MQSHIGRVLQHHESEKPPHLPWIHQLFPLSQVGWRLGAHIWAEKEKGVRTLQRRDEEEQPRQAVERSPG